MGQPCDACGYDLSDLAPIHHALVRCPECGLEQPAEFVPPNAERVLGRDCLGAAAIAGGVAVVYAAVAMWSEAWGRMAVLGVGVPAGAVAGGVLGGAFGGFVATRRQGRGDVGRSAALTSLVCGATAAALGAGLCVVAGVVVMIVTPP